MTKPIYYYDDICMNALTSYCLVKCAGIEDQVDFKYVSLLKGEQLATDYIAKFPLHHLPGLEVSEGEHFDESATILRYFGNTFPECEKFYPKDPVVRAQIERAMDWRNTEYMPALTSATYGALWGVPFPMFTNPEVVKGAVGMTKAALEYLANHLLKGRKFIAGDNVSLAEFHIIPSIATIRPFDGTSREIPIPERVEQWIKDFYEEFPLVLETQQKVQIPVMTQFHDKFLKELPKEEE